MREHWTLDPDVTFLNHGSFGACPRLVLDEQARLRAEMEREPVQFFLRGLEDRLDAARRAAAAFVGARPSEFAFVRNATEGVNAVLRSLRLSPGDELLTTEHEYNACKNVLDYVAARAGAEVRVVRLGFAGLTRQAVVERVVAAVTPRTRLALLDHVTSPTGLVLPLAELVSALDDAGVDTLVDGAHAPGMLDLDVSAIGAAYYTANFHKWTCAPKGAAMLCVREDRQEGTHAAILSHGFNSPRDRPRWLEEMDWPGTTDPSAWLCVPTAIETVGGLLEGGWDAVRAHNHGLALRARAILADALRTDALPDEALVGSMAALPIADAPPGPATGALYSDPDQRALFDERHIEVPLPPWPRAPERLVRVSAFVYNTEADYVRLGEALLERGLQPG